MLKFVKAAEVANSQGTVFKPKDSGLSGQELGTLTMMVMNRFIEQVNWDDIVSIYVGGLVDQADQELITRAVKALVDGGLEFNG